MSKYLDMARKWLEDAQVKCPHLAYRDARECVICVASLLSEVAKQERERCAQFADAEARGWTNRLSAYKSLVGDMTISRERASAGRMTAEVIAASIRALGEE